jgi:hypothetical protein
MGRTAIYSAFHGDDQGHEHGPELLGLGLRRVVPVAYSGLEYSGLEAGSESVEAFVDPLQRNGAVADHQARLGLAHGEVRQRK